MKAQVAVPSCSSDSSAGLGSVPTLAGLHPLGQYCGGRSNPVSASLAPSPPSPNPQVRQLVGSRPQFPMDT